MKVLHLGRPHLPIGTQFGGAVERRILELARAQRAQGLDVTVASLAPDAGEPVDLGTTVFQVKTRTRRPIRDYEYYVRAAIEARRLQPDVLHVHGAPDAAYLKRWLGCPFVLSVDYYRYRGSSSMTGHAYWRRALEQSDRVLPVSAACGEEIRAYFRFPSSRMSVLYNGVNLAQFFPSSDQRHATRTALDIDVADTVFLYLGRMCYQKGTPVLINAFSQLRGRDASAKLLLVGPMGQFSGKEHDLLLGAVPPEFGNPGVRYLGAVSEARLNPLMNAADVFVMPTIQDEMFGMAALEAHAAGLPVVASKLGGLVEAVSPRAGAWVDPGDVSGLAREMRAMAARVREVDLVRSARMHAHKYSWDRVAGDAKDIYQSVITSSR